MVIKMNFAVKNGKKMSTPQKEACQLLRDHGVSPGKKPRLVKQLSAYKIIAMGVKYAGPKVKLGIIKHIQRKGYASIISYKLGISRKRLSSQKASVQLCRERRLRHQQLVVAFLKEEENSYLLPGKKDVRKGGKQTYALMDTMESFYKRFQKRYPNIKIGRSKFVASRPKYMKLIQNTDRLQCLCVECENARLLLKAINTTPSLTTFIHENPKDIRRDKVTERIGHTDSVHYTEWGRHDVFDAKNNKWIKRVTPENLSLEPADFTTKFLETFAKLEEHIHRYTNQHGMIRQLKKSLTEGEVVCQLDFAENYRCV